MNDTQLDRAGVAERTGLALKSLDTYKARNVLPEPDGYVGRSPWWWASTIDQWDAQRPKVNRPEPPPVDRRKPESIARAERRRRARERAGSVAHAQ